MNPTSARIVFLHYAGPPVVGGVESVMRHHAELLSDVGHRVELLVGRGEKWRKDIRVAVLDLIDSLHPETLAVKESLDSGVVPPEFAPLSEKIEHELEARLRGADVVIAHNLCTMAKNLPLTAALRRICAKPEAPRLIAWHHDLAWTADRYKDELYNAYPWSILLEPWNEVGITHVAVSQMRSDELAELQGIPSDEIKVIPSGVSYAEFYQLDATARELVSTLGLETHYPVFLLPVRITKRKNIEFAMHILAELQTQYPQAALVVTGPPGAHNIGNSGYFSELLSLRSTLGLTPNSAISPESKSKPAVYFLAEISSQKLSDSTIAGLFRCADALLMPSAEEGFGIPIIEAGLSGMPVFCSDIPPFREIAGSLANFFDLTDTPRHVAELIVAAIENDTRMGLRKRVRQHYSWSAILTEKILPLLGSDSRVTTSCAITSDTTVLVEAVAEDKAAWQDPLPQSRRR